MGIAIGIDLGTTNSVSCIKKINLATILNAEGEELTPSCVTAVPHDDLSFDFIVGRHSRNLLKQYPEQTITSIKRLMGRDFEDLEVQNIVGDQRVGYKIETDISEPGSIRIPLGGTIYTPEMISGLILGKLICDGEAELQGKIDQAVVTIPAYFSDRQKFATRAACDYAGIKLLRLLPEPTAAVISFGLEALGENDSRTVMVFDLGGGTFDISVLSIAGGNFMEVTKGGDMWLGGDNIDQLLVDHVLFTTQKTINCKSIIELIDKLASSDKARFMVEIKEKAEAAKIALSTQEVGTVEMFGLLRDEQGKLIDIDVTISRADLAQILTPIVQRVTSIARQILHEIRFDLELIDTVLMVGGSSLIPAIQDELKSMFGTEKVIIHPRPMLAIAEGAALMAAKITSQEDLNTEKTFSMMHSTAHDYYLQLADGKRHLLVARNTPLPFSVEEKLKFTYDTQSLARLRVFNEVDGVLEIVGELWFHKEYTEDFSRKQRYATELMLRFSVDEDNIISMKAWDTQNTTRSVEAKIARGGLSAKLYNDLECTLSSIIANSDSACVENDALQLSSSIVTTILSASDPITGETRVAQKLKAQQQINTLKSCHQKDLAPLSVYKLLLLAQQQAGNILTGKEHARLTSLLQDLRQAIENLDDVVTLENIVKEVTSFYKNTPIAVDLARAENIAVVMEASSPPGWSNKIRRQAKILADLHMQQDKTKEKVARDSLYDFMDSLLSWSDAPSGRFDRDVCF